MKGEKGKRRIRLVALLVFSALVFAWILSLDLGKRRAASINCRSAMISIGFAARMWANDNGDVFPNNLTALSNEVNTTRILFCPADRKHPRPRTSDWTTFDEAACSYQVVTPGIKDGDSHSVFIRCKVHGHLGYGDGSVFDGVKRSWDKGGN